jgi:hypothetical protein
MFNMIIKRDDVNSNKKSAGDKRSDDQWASTFRFLYSFSFRYLKRRFFKVISWCFWIIWSARDISLIKELPSNARAETGCSGNVCADGFHAHLWPICPYWAAFTKFV